MPKMPGPFNSSEYATVASRVALFLEQYPTGRIITELVSRTERETVFCARVYREASDAHPAATGWASEREGDGEINVVACLENTETSAVGRALANLGFLASTQRPSAEEMAKASRARVRARRPTIVRDESPRYSGPPPAASGDEAGSALAVRFREKNAPPPSSLGVPVCPPEASALVRQDESADDVRELLQLAVRSGFSVRRAAVLRDRLFLPHAGHAEAIGGEHLAAWEQRLREWLLRRMRRLRAHPDTVG